MPLRREQIQEAEKAQHLAAHDTWEHVSVVAGPGTGKSATIEERVCWLLAEENVPPACIVAVSFTQDLNPMDLRFVPGMAERGVRLFVAGDDDDDQSLYAFRYASPQGIARFMHERPGSGDHTLHHCFRCAPRVLDAAQTLIRQYAADGRIEKTLVSLWADADPPGPRRAGMLELWLGYVWQSEQEVQRRPRSKRAAPVPAVAANRFVRHMGRTVSPESAYRPVSVEEPVEAVINTIFDSAHRARLVVCAGAGLSRARCRPTCRAGQSSGSGSTSGCGASSAVTSLRRIRKT